MIDPTLIIRQLERLGILPHELAHTIAACAGLRNRLVHESDEIDPARIHEALQAAARHVPQYLAHVHGHIDRLPS